MTWLLTAYLPLPLRPVVGRPPPEDEGRVAVGVVGKLRAVPAVEKPSPPALLVCDDPKREEVREAGVEAVGVVAAAPKLGKEVVVAAAGVDGVAAGVKAEPMLKLKGVDAAAPVPLVGVAPVEGHRPPPADGVAAPAGVDAPAGAGVAEAAGVASGIT
jgi:hypothetical protein